MGIKHDKILADIETLTDKLVLAEQYDCLTVISRIKDLINDLVYSGDTASETTVSTLSTSTLSAIASVAADSSPDGSIGSVDSITVT